MWLGFCYNLVWGGIYLVGAALFIGKFGAAALPFSAAFAYVVTLIWALWYMRNDLPPGMGKRIGLALAFAVLLSATAIAMPPEWRLWMALPVTAIATFVAMFFLADPSW